jgi:hypothetical protein
LNGLGREEEGIKKEKKSGQPKKSPPKEGKTKLEEEKQREG